MWKKNKTMSADQLNWSNKDGKWRQSCGCQRWDHWLLEAVVDNDNNHSEFPGAGAGPLQWVFLGELLPPDYKVTEIKILVEMGSFKHVGSLMETIAGSLWNNGVSLNSGNLRCHQSIPLHSLILHWGSRSLLVCCILRAHSHQWSSSLTQPKECLSSLLIF